MNQCSPKRRKMRILQSYRGTHILKWRISLSVKRASRIFSRRLNLIKQADLACILKDLSDVIACPHCNLTEESYTWGGTRGLEVTLCNPRFQNRRPIQSQQLPTSVTDQYLLQAAGTHHHQQRYGKCKFQNPTIRRKNQQHKRLPTTPA